MNVKKLKLTVLSLIMFACVVATGRAQQRPLLTEDVDIVPQGAVRINLGVDFMQNAKFPLSGLRGDLTRVGVFNASAGLAPNVQFELEGVLQNYLAINSAQASAVPLNLAPNANSTNDYGDFMLSTKIKLKNETRNSPSLGFKFGFQLPNTDQKKGIGNNQNNVFGIVLVGKKFGSRNARKTPRLNVFGNIGLGILTAPVNPFTQNDVVLYGLAGIYRVNNRFNIVSEINGRASTRSGIAPLGTESQSEFRLGTQIYASGLRFDAAGIGGIGKFSQRSGITFGVTYESPNIFTPAK